MTRSAPAHRSKRPARAMLKSFHDAWYAPNNALLIIVGDVELRRHPAPGARAVRQPSGQNRCPRARSCASPVRRNRSASTPIDPVGTQMIALRTPGLDSPDFPALEVLSDVLSSRRFDLYGLVPQGKAIDAEFSLDPLPQAGLAYADGVLYNRADHKALEPRCARSSGESPAMACRRSWSRPPRCTSAVKPNSRRIRSKAPHRYGPMRSRCTDLTRRKTIWRASRRSPWPTLIAWRASYLDLDHAVTAVMVPRGSGRPVATAAASAARRTSPSGRPSPRAAGLGAGGA
jgi:hypothetical protein